MLRVCSGLASRRLCVWIMALYSSMHEAQWNHGCCCRHAVGVSAGQRRTGDDWHRGVCSLKARAETGDGSASDVSANLHKRWASSEALGAARGSLRCFLSPTALAFIVFSFRFPFFAFSLHGFLSSVCYPFISFICYPCVRGLGPFQFYCQRVLVVRSFLLNTLTDQYP